MEKKHNNERTFICSHAYQFVVQFIPPCECECDCGCGCVRRKLISETFPKWKTFTAVQKESFNVGGVWGRREKSVAQALSLSARGRISNGFCSIFRHFGVFHLNVHTEQNMDVSDRLRSSTSIKRRTKILRLYWWNCLCVRAQPRIRRTHKWVVCCARWLMSVQK